MKRRSVFLFLLILFITARVSAQGLLPTLDDVYVVSERIILTYNPEGTVTAYIDVAVSAYIDQFAWVIPIPSLSGQDQNIALASFNALESATVPTFDTPPIPDCAPISVPYLSIEAGDPAFAQTTTPDPHSPAGFTEAGIERGDEIIGWLIDRGIGITPEEQALIEAYAAEGKVFLVYKIANPFFARDVQPIAVTFPADHITFPLRLTALTAVTNAPVTVWIFGDSAAVAQNYAQLAFDDADLRGAFDTLNATNYLAQIDQIIGETDGEGFVTEYAQPTTSLAAVADPLIRQLASRYPYVTRLTTRISSAELSVDPVFTFSDAAPDVSNTHDLSQVDPNVFWGC
jgi:hypothetical protein